MYNKFYIIRHGETEANADGEIRMCGSTDLNITHKSFWDAMYLSKKMKSADDDFKKVKNIYVSELNRTKQTAFALFLKENYTISPELNEINFGENEMSVKKYLPADILNKWEKDPGGLVFKNGDSMKERAENTTKYIKGLMKENTEPFAVISSSTIVRLLIMQLMDVDIKEFHRITLPYLSIIEITYDTENIEKIYIKINT